jgi:hypothetical protein
MLRSQEDLDWSNRRQREAFVRKREVWLLAARRSVSSLACSDKANV